MNAQLAAPGAAPPLDRALLAVEGLSVRYRSERGVVSAVDDASFVVQRAEVLGLVGESGCGKSTVAGAILGLATAERRGARVDHLRGRGAGGGGSGGAAPTARQPHRHHRPGPTLVARSDVPDRRADRRGGAHARQGLALGRPPAGARRARRGRHPRPTASATAIRRTA